MPQERPNHYGHLLRDAPKEPIKTVHYPTLAEAERMIRRDRLWITFACIAAIVAIVLFSR